MTNSTTALKINPSDEMIRLGPLQIRFLITHDDSDGSASVFEFTIPAGEKLRAPAHSHDGFEETIYGLSGVLTWTVDGQAIEVGPGQALCLPRGAVHRFDNFGVEDAKVLVVASPALFGPAYFREVQSAMMAAGDGPPDAELIADIYRRHGLTPAPVGV